MNFKKSVLAVSILSALMAGEVDASNVKSSTGHTGNQIRKLTAREIIDRGIDVNTASYNELLAYNTAVRQEEEASIARGLDMFAKDPEYITRMIQGYKEIKPHASIEAFENFIKSFETLRAYYIGTDEFRNLNYDQVYSDYRQFFPEQESWANTQRKDSFGNRCEKFVRTLISPFKYDKAQKEAVNDLKKFPKEEITALKSKQLLAYKITQELENLKSSDWRNMSETVRNNTVQKINSYKKALVRLEPTLREQQLIDSGTVRAYDKAVDYKLALDKDRADFEGSSVFSD